MENTLNHFVHFETSLGLCQWTKYLRSDRLTRSPSLNRVTPYCERWVSQTDQTSPWSWLTCKTLSFKHDGFHRPMDHCDPETFVGPGWLASPTQQLQSMTIRANPLLLFAIERLNDPHGWGQRHLPQCPRSGWCNDQPVPSGYAPTWAACINGGHQECGPPWGPRKTYTEPSN